jgi:hypothetical protein
MRNHENMKYFYDCLKILIACRSSFGVTKHVNYTSKTTRAMNPATSMTSAYETYMTPTRTVPLQIELLTKSTSGYPGREIFHIFAISQLL